MARAHFLTYLLDTEGRPIAGATVTVREPGTSTDISQTIYAEDDSAGNTTKDNPFTGDADGRIEVYLDTPQIVDILVQKTGFDSRTVRGTVLQLTASDLTVANDGVPLDQEPTINFSSSFVLTDDPAETETEVALNFGEAADITTQAFADSASAGTTGEVADAGHKHAMPANPVTAHEGSFTHANIATTTTGLANHLADTSDAHDASAISIVDAGSHFDATEVESALTELAVDVGAGVVSHEAAVDPHAGYQLESAKGAASGYAPLNSSTMLDHAYYDTQAHGNADHDFDYVRARRVTNISVTPTDTWFDVPLTEDVDGGGWHSNSTNPERFTIPASVTGTKIVCVAQLSFANNSDNTYRGIRIVHVLGADGTTTTEVAKMRGAAQNGQSTVFNIASYPIAVVTGDWFKLQAITAGVCNAEPTDTWFTAYSVGGG